MGWSLMREITSVAYVVVDHICKQDLKISQWLSHSVTILASQILTFLSANILRKHVVPQFVLVSNRQWNVYLQWQNPVGETTLLGAA